MSDAAELPPADPHPTDASTADQTPVQEDFPVASTTDEPLDLAGDAGSSDPGSTGAGSDRGGLGEGADEGVSDDDAAGGEAGGGQRLSLADLLEREGEVAADYLEGLLDIIDADGDIDMDVEGDRAVVSIVGDRLRHLVGQDGAVLDALQELTRLAVARETGVRSRLMLDIGGHRARRRSDLTVIGTKAAEEAIATGEPVKLGPMSAFERKVVHDAVAAAGLRSESEGVEPQRRVVVLPTNAVLDTLSGAGAADATASADPVEDVLTDAPQNDADQNGADQNGADQNGADQNGADTGEEEPTADQG